GFPDGCAISGPFGGGSSSVAISADGTLLSGGLDRSLHALRFDDLTFREVWTLPAGDEVQVAISASGGVLAGSDSGDLFWASAAGEKLGSFALGEKLLASPVLALDLPL